MFLTISWGRFSTVILSFTALYYLFIIVTFYRKPMIRWLKSKAGLVVLSLLTSRLLYAQDGKQGIDQANDLVRGYFTEGITLVYAISGVLALIGAIRVFKAFTEGQHDEAKRYAAGWFGGVLFVIIVVTVIKVFFGL
jgi:O-antigen ligase